MRDTINDGQEINDTLNSAIADIDGAPIVIDGDDMSEYADDTYDEPWDGFNSDAEADADVLRMIGHGCDEDYAQAGDGFFDE